MAKAYKKDNDLASIVNEDNSAMRFYASQEEQELERLKDDMNRSATEKFHRLMGLMKIGNMMNKAVIHHKA
ncbi:MAG TPA: hypothetical protein VL832_24440 [Puia sp.]|jgi:hypothetical protein|nr:hypothetical protein [Puia sp.]